MKNILCFVIHHPELISAVAVLLSFAFSICVYVRTQKLFKQTARPMLLPGEIKYTDSQIFISLKNLGEHPAKDLRIKYGVAPLASPEQYKSLPDRVFVNKIGISGEATITLGRAETTDKLLYFRVGYKDAFLGKFFQEEIWLSFNSGTRTLSEPTRDIIEKFLPYIR